jgi:4'-phosphopantetheinyl transferase
MALQRAFATTFLDEALRVLNLAALAPLTPGHAQVLLFDSLPWRSFHDEALPLLGEQERERSLRFRLVPQRETYVVAHALWRVALSRVLDRDPTAVPLAFAPGGQPQLAGTASATSLSHSGSHVAIALAPSRTIGVDIEQSPPRGRLRELAGMICTMEEAAAIRALPHERHEAALLALWTRKEALLKAFGTGLREAPETIAAPAGPLITPPASAGAVPACRIHPLALRPGLVGAMAAPDDIDGFTQLWLVSPAELPAR